MRIERHVFGSVSGYTTLARSGGLSHIQHRMLETFAFGQTTDPQYLNSLAQSPAYISRPLGPKHRAITRVLQGNPDDKGRITLVFVSAVLSANDWIRVLKGDVWPLLRSSTLWQWDGRPALKHVELPIAAPDQLALTPDVARYVLGIISELERYDAGGKALLLDGSRFESTIVRAIDMLIPDSVKADFSSGARSLSANLDVRLNCFARGANVRGSAAGGVMYTPSADGSLRPYATALAGAGLRDGTIPWDVIKSFKGYGVVDELDYAIEIDGGLAQGATRRARAVKKKMSTAGKIGMGFGIFLLMAVIVLGIGLWRRGEAAEDRDALADQAKALTQIVVTEFARESEIDQKGILRDAEAILQKAQTQKRFPRAVREDLSAWIKTQEELRKAVDGKKKRLKELIGALAHGFPKVAEMQLAPNDVTRLRQALVAARGPDAEPSVKVGLGTVNVAHACREETSELANRADKVERELSKRKRLYEAFVEKARRADKHGQEVRAAKLRQQVDKMWRKCAQADPAKKRTIEEWFAQLADLDGRSKRQGGAKKHLLGIIGEVAKAGKRGALNKVRPRFEAAVRTAKQYEALKPVVEQAGRAMATAEERTAPKRIPTSQEVRKDKKWHLTIEIGKKILGISKIKGETPKERKQVQTAWLGVHGLVAQLAKTDKKYAEALAKLLNLHMKKREAKPASKIEPRYLMPEWLTLKNHTRTHLGKPMEALVRIRGLVLSGAQVRLVVDRSGKTVQNPHDLRNREKVLKVLDKWINVLRGQNDKVNAIAKKKVR